MDNGHIICAYIDNEQHVATAVAAMADPRSEYTQFYLYVCVLFSWNIDEKLTKSTARELA